MAVLEQEVLTPPRRAVPKLRRASEREVLVKALIYGEPGAGKTYLACTAPNPIILLTEPAVSDATMLAVRRDLGVDPAVWEIHTWEDLEEAYEYLQGGQHEFTTIVIDSFTDLCRRLIRSVLDAATAKRASHDPDILEQGDWQRVGERLRYIARLFRDLPYDVVFTALVMEIQSEMLKVPYVQPKSVARELAAYCNLVGYLGVMPEGDKYVRLLQVEQSATVVAKNPGGTLPPVVRHPNLTEIFKAVKGGLPHNGC